MSTLFTSVILPLASVVAKDLIGLLRDVVGALGSSASQTAKSAAELEPVNSRSSVEDVNRMTEVFETYKEQVQEQSEKIGAAVQTEVEYYFEELNAILQENESLMKAYHIKPKGIDRKTQRLLHSMKERIASSISSDISLNNASCRTVIGMLPGTKKEEAMSGLLKTSMNQALGSCCTQLREVLGEIFEDMEEEIPGAAQRAADEAKAMSEDLERLAAENSPEQIKAVTEAALEKTALCDIAIELLGGDDIGAN